MVSTILNHSMTNINIIDYATKLIVFFNAYLIFYTQITNISTNKSQKGYGQANTHGLSLFFLCITSRHQRVSNIFLLRMINHLGNPIEELGCQSQRFQIFIL